MQRFAIRFAVISAIVLAAGSASANQKPAKQPQKQCDANVCVQHRVNSQGQRTSTTVTPKPGSRFNGGKPQTHPAPQRAPQRKSLDGKFSLQVPQGDRKPLPPFPGRRNQVVARIVDTVDQCGDDVGLPTDDGRVECVPAPTPQSEDKQAFDNSQPRYCRRVDKTQCRKDEIIRSLPPVWMTQAPDPSVPEGQNPGSIYPGLPPAPKLTALAVVEFKPVGTPKGGRGSGNQGSGASRLVDQNYEPEPTGSPSGTGGTSTR